MAMGLQELARMLPEVAAIVGEQAIGLVKGVRADENLGPGLPVVRRIAGNLENLPSQKCGFRLIGSNSMPSDSSRAPGWQSRRRKAPVRRRSHRRRAARAARGQRVVKPAFSHGSPLIIA